MPVIQSSEHLVFFAVFILSIFMPLFIHISMLRFLGLFKKPDLRQKGVIISFFLGLAFSGITFLFWVRGLDIKSWKQVFWSGVYLFSTYAIFGYVYFHIFNLSETARRTRILREIDKTKVLKKDELIEIYTCRDMVSVRLRRLLALGELRLDNNKYILKNKGLLIVARIISGFRKILFP